jgi:DedD protein
MATTKSAEISATELELKRRGRRRLIGAITLGLIAVVFLPMIFDSEPRRTGSAMKPQEISVQLPSKEGQPALPAPSVAPVPAAPAPAAIVSPPVPAVAAAGEAPAQAAAPTPEAVKETPKEVVKEPSKEMAKPAPKVDKTEKSDSKAVAAKTGFVVQLGVFGDADNAKQAIAKMKEAKLPVYTESIPIKSGNATRVRVGPYANKEKAEAALAQVKLAGNDGKIVPLK